MPANRQSPWPRRLLALAMLIVGCAREANAQEVIFGHAATSENEQSQVPTGSIASAKARDDILAEMEAQSKHRTLEGAKCGPGSQDCNGHARRLFAEPKPAPSVTLLTLSSDSDLLPLELMLPHQVEWSSREGRERLQRVLVLKMPPSPHHTVLEPGAVPFSMVPLRATGDRDGADEAIQLDAGTLRDSSFFDRFLVNDGDRSAKDLAGLWENGFLPSSGVDDHSVFRTSTTALGLLSAIDQCNTTYCAFIEPRVFVHRHPDQPGWIDRAVDLLEADPDLVVVQAPKMRTSEMDTSCSTAQSPDGSFSQRYFVLHRKRLESFLPIRVDCAPRCDTFEALFVLPPDRVGLMSCSPTAAWVIHAPENEESMLRLFEGCARATGREEELLELGKNTTSRGGRRLDGPGAVPLPALPKEHEHNEHVVGLHRRLAASSWVGLPEFLARIASPINFGEAATISAGETIPNDLSGWSCPSASERETRNV